MAFRRGSHSVYDTQYHLVWAPKYRKKILSGAVGERMRELLKAENAKLKCVVADFTLDNVDNVALKDVLSKSGDARDLIFGRGLHPKAAWSLPTASRIFGALCPHVTSS